jgi:hypothetical protein
MLSQIRLDIANITLYPDSNTANYPPRTAWRTQVEALLPGIQLGTSQRVPSITTVAGPTFAGDPDPSSQVTIVILWQQPGEAQERRFEIVGMVSRQ